MTGLIWAILGAAIAAIFTGWGSARGVQYVGEAASGVVAEHPERFGSLLLLQALPATHGIYGLLIAFLLMQKIGVLSGQLVDLSLNSGILLFAGCLPIAIVGLIAAIAQGKTAVAAVHIVAKNPGEMAKGMTFAAMIETFSVLALLVSYLIVWNIAV